MGKLQTRQSKREQVSIEAVCGADDAQERWLRAFDVLAEYARADDRKESEGEA